MARRLRHKIRQWNLAWHRDLGYFFSSLIIIYCISGIALNHVNDWNPDFIIYKDTISIGRPYHRSEIDAGKIKEFGRLVHEDHYKTFDFPTNNQVKIYYDNATLHIHLETATGLFEKIDKRHVFYETNVIHRNSLKGWKWMADIFSLMLILISVTGLFILKGKYGLRRRGVWILSAGLLLPVAAILIFYFIQQ